MTTPWYRIAVPAALALALAGCSAADPADLVVPSAATTSAATSGSAIPDTTKDAHSVDLSWDEASVVDVDLDAGTTTDAGAVDITGGLVAISAPGTYRLHGELAGTVRVSSPADGTVRLVLDGVDITGTSGPAIDIDEADEAAVVLADGSVNTLADAAGDAADTEANAALYSRTDLTIGGTGALDVDGRSNDGIGSVDGLVIEGGTITVDAVDDGIRGKDYLVLRGGEITVTAGDDGLKADNEEATELGSIALAGGSTTITAGDDAVHAEGTLTVSGGTLDVTASVEGIEAAVIDISGGDLSIVSSDDAVNVSDGSDGAGGGMPGVGGSSGLHLSISGGSLVVDAEGDGIDVNGSATMSGGTVVVHGPTGSGNGALDVDGTFTISGGTLLAAGSAGMAVAPDADSPQGWVAFAVDGAAGSQVEVTDADGTVLGELTSRKAFASLVFSAPGVTTGSEYSLDGGGASATATAGELVGGGFGGGPGSGDGPGGGGGRGDRGGAGGPGGPGATDGTDGEPPARP